MRVLVVGRVVLIFYSGRRARHVAMVSGGRIRALNDERGS